MKPMLIPASSARNSELYKVVKDGILKPGQSATAKLPSGNKITLTYIKDDGIERAREMSEIYRIPVKAIPEEYIEKSIVNSHGNKVVSRHDIIGDATRLKSITEHCRSGKINHSYAKDGSKNGQVLIKGRNGDKGYVFNPDRTATDNIRGICSAEAYKEAIAK